MPGEEEKAVAVRAHDTGLAQGITPIVSGLSRKIIDTARPQPNIRFRSQPLG